MSLCPEGVFGRVGAKRIQYKHIYYASSSRRVQGPQLIDWWRVPQQKSVSQSVNSAALGSLLLVTSQRAWVSNHTNLSRAQAQPLFFFSWKAEQQAGS